MMNADPRKFEFAELLSQVSFHEAIELAYYGAKVIHPKTIQPLQRKKIPLRIRSFVDSAAPGTLIGENLEQKPALPFYIMKENQMLLSVSSPDFAFIVEDHLSEIFSILAKYGVSVNLMQNSAISFSVCFDARPMQFDKLLADLQSKFEVHYNEGLTLYTIRHYTAQAVQKLLAHKSLILEQKSRNTLQWLVNE